MSPELQLLHGLFVFTLWALAICGVLHLIMDKPALGFLHMLAAGYMWAISALGEVGIVIHLIVMVALAVMMIWSKQPSEDLPSSGGC